MKKIIFAIILLLQYACTSDKKDATSPNEGAITITVDESMRNVAEALTDIYQNNHPKTKLKLIYKPENESIRYLLHQKTNVVFSSRELNENEQEYFAQQLKIKYTPAILAIDGIAIIVNKNSSEATISNSELKNELINGTKKIVFDNVNSSNLNYLYNKFQLKNLNNKNIVSANGTDNLIEYITKNNNALGIIGYNWLSDMQNPKTKMILSKIKLLPVSDTDGVGYAPSKDNFFNQKYPLTKYIYLLNNEPYFGLSNAFIRYACSQQGQMIVEHEGLQPYRLFEKNIILTK